MSDIAKEKKTDFQWVIPKLTYAGYSRFVVDFINRVDIKKPSDTKKRENAVPNEIKTSLADGGCRPGCKPGNARNEPNSETGILTKKTILV